MRKCVVLALWACLVSAGLTAAQNPDRDWTPPPPLSQTPPPPIEVAPPAPPPGPRHWLNAEFLRWQAKTPMPIPIVTTGNTNDGKLAGTIGRPDTRVLFGIDDVDFTYLPGMRFSLGAWLDTQQDFAIEHTFFYLPRQATIFRTGNDSAVPGVYLSGFNVVIGREDSGILADALSNFGGSVAVTTDFQLWGAELNGLGACWRSPTCDLQLLAGLRYVHLEESLEVAGFSRDLGIDSRITSVDRFGTVNNFLGGQLGVRCRWQPSMLGFEMTGKFALGSNRQTVDIQGENARFGSVFPVPIRSPGGFYAQPSNIGTVTNTDFAFVPSLDVKVDLQCSPHLRMFFTYGFLVFNNAVRPGNQIDRNLNLSKSPVFAPPPPRSDVPLPASRFDTSPLFADGFSIGIELRF